MDENEPAVEPGINDCFSEPDELQKYVEHFRRPGRTIYDARTEIVQSCQPDNQMVIADVGAGTGEFSRLFAPLVKHVYVIDLFKHFVDYAVAQLKAEGLTNVTGVVGQPNDIGLPKETLDMALLFNTYHHLEQPFQLTRSIFDALKPNGQLVLVDLDPETTSEKPVDSPEHIRAGREVFCQEIEEQGFVRQPTTPDFMTGAYLDRFVKPA